VAVRAKGGKYGGAEVFGAAGEKPGWTFETNDGEYWQRDVFSRRQFLADRGSGVRGVR
jgi:hypothetical protein